MPQPKNMITQLYRLLVAPVAGWHQRYAVWYIISISSPNNQGMNACDLTLFSQVIRGDPVSMSCDFVFLGYSGDPVSMSCDFVFSGY